jgi:RNA polymerase sigma-70 factor (ECF subfamily)
VEVIPAFRSFFSFSIIPDHFQDSLSDRVKAFSEGGGISQGREQDSLNAFLYGDESVGRLSVSAWAGRLESLFRQLTGDRDVAEEMVQETFVRALRSARRFEGKSSVWTWLCTIGLNCLRDRLRRKKARRRWRDTEGKLEGVEYRGPSPLALATHEDELRALRGAVERLPGNLREVVVLHYFQEMSLGQVADVLGLGYGTVKYRARKAIETLDRCLGPSAVRGASGGGSIEPGGCMFLGANQT